jgi:hypothetical protein
VYQANRLAQSSVLCLVVRSDCGNSRITGKPLFTASRSDRSRHTVAERWIWQSRPLSFKWQDWIAPGGRISSYRWQDNSLVHRECRPWQHNVAFSGSIPLQPAFSSQRALRTDGLNTTGFRSVLRFVEECLPPAVQVLFDVDCCLFPVFSMALRIETCPRLLA